ncbi:MAG: hypothetical protein IPH43_15015 [Xanthomonadales bacterium]|nr:hypothetical protein [Xanthomonadales bacterium]
MLQRHAKLAGYERELARTRVHLAGIVNALGRTEEAAAIQVQAMAEQTDTADVPSVELAEAVRVSGEIATSQRDFAAALDHSDRTWRCSFCSRPAEPGCGDPDSRVAGEGAPCPVTHR